MSASSESRVARRPARRPARRSTRSPAGLAAVTVAAGAVALLCLLPIGLVVVQGVTVDRQEALSFLLRPRILELLGNTALLGLTIPLTLVIGTAAGWVVERTTLPGAGVWQILLLAPLAVPSFVSSYAWSSALPTLHGAVGAVMITTLAYFPFVFLPVAALLRSLDGADLEVARTLGLGPWAAVRRVLLPELRPALCGGGLLVALHLLAEFGVLEMMLFPTFTTAILQQYAIGFSTTAGNLLAIVLMAICAVVLFSEHAVRGRIRIARLGPGAQGQAARVTLGRWTAPVLLGLTLLTGGAFGFPLAMVARWLAVGIANGGIPVLDVVDATLTTLTLASVTGLVTIAAAGPAAWVVHHAAGRIRPLAVAVERATFVASALPGVVVGLALVTLAVSWVRPAYQTAGLLVLAYLILFVPRAIISWRAGLAAAPPEMSEAARSLGTSGPATFGRVVLPLVAPSALAGFVLVFLGTSTELTATLLLSPTGTRTLATAFWAASDELDYVASAPYAAALIVLTAPLTVLVRRQILAAAGRSR